jgi:hypothetical protein
VTNWKEIAKSNKIVLYKLPRGQKTYDLVYKEAVERIEGRIADSRGLAKQVLAWTLYKDCYMVTRRAPQEFQPLLKEIQTLSGSLNILQEEIKDIDSILMLVGEDRVRMVKELVSRVHVTLKGLQKLANKYKILGSGSKRKQIWAKLTWSMEFSSIDSMRSKVSSSFLIF